MATHPEIGRRLTDADYRLNSIDAARFLLGKRLVVWQRGRRVSGVIVETEAYCPAGTDDLACHASKNKGNPTPRTRPMFGQPGTSYVYLTYGIHWLFNIVTDLPGRPSAVLIRALEPVEGEPLMLENRPGRPRRQWTSGPAKLTQALGIDREWNEMNLCDPNGVIWCETDRLISDLDISAGPRIGLGKTPEPWFSKPWRFWVTGNRFVSV